MDLSSEEYRPRRVSLNSQMNRMLNRKRSLQEMSLQDKINRGGGAVRFMLQEMKDVVDAPLPDKDKRVLHKAVSDVDIAALKELRASGKVTTEEILIAAVDRDEVRILDEFKDDLENNDSLALLDYSVEHRRKKCIRKISNMTNNLGDRVLSLLNTAIEQQDLPYVNQLLDEHAKLVDGHHETPLHMAARATCHKMVRSLSEHNLNWVNKAGRNGCTPLHTAAEHGSYEVCQTLLELGANVNAKEDQGRTPLFCCVESHRERTLQCMEALLDHRALVDEKNKKGLTALHVAAMGGKKAHVKLLLANNPHVDIQTDTGVSALELIAQKVPSTIEEFKKHLDKGIKLEDPDNETKIRLDFRKLFSVKEILARDTYGTMSMFLNLTNTPFECIVEHPLVRAFLAIKMRQVLIFYSFLLVAHLLLSIIFSIYCVLLFSYICPPPPETREIRTNLFSVIECNSSTNNMNWSDTQTKHAINTVNLAWVLLTIFVPVFIGRESIRISANVKNYFLRIETWSNCLMIILMLALICAGRLLYQDENNEILTYPIYRWQYYVASCCCFLLWIQMVVMIGRVPTFGKYVQMYRSVACEMGKSAVAYIPLLVGFMMMCMIMFSEQTSFNTNFLGVVGKILVMMTGEFDYTDLNYPTSTTVRKTNNENISEIEEHPEYNHFPGLAHLTILLFILCVGIVMMNLLVALAVNDVKQLAKTAKRDQLISQVEMINYVEKAISSQIFKYLPSKIQEFFKNKLLNIGRSFNMMPEVNYYSNNSNSDSNLSESLKKELYDLCIRREKRDKHDKREKEKDARRDVLEEKYDKMKETNDKLKETNDKLVESTAKLNELLLNQQQMLLHVQELVLNKNMSTSA